MRRALAVLVLAACGLHSVRASSAARAFLDARSFAIDWDIGLAIPPGWPPLPCSGGPGLRYSPTDRTAVGLRISVPSFYYPPIRFDLFSAWRFIDPPGAIPHLAATAELHVYREAQGSWFLEPSLGLAASYEGETIGLYSALESAFLFGDPTGLPRLYPDLRIGIVFRRAQNLSIELALEGVGTYSSLTRTSIGRPVLSIGMVNRF